MRKQNKSMEAKEQVGIVTEDLLKRLGVEGAVSVDIDETEAYRVHIETEETGLLIGFHGKTLESLQIILGLLVSKALGSWVRVYVNVGDYREKREEALMLMAQQAAERSLAQGRAIELSHLSASERRVIHLTLSGDERVETESIGEGTRRTLLVKPKA
jgi:spoIIIJ-associated protein